MSNYIAKAFNPVTRKEEDAEFLDDFFGRHEYGVRFSDGKVYPIYDISFDLTPPHHDSKYIVGAEKAGEAIDKAIENAIVHHDTPDTILVANEDVKKFSDIIHHDTEKGWEERFDELGIRYWKGGDRVNVVDFISTELENASDEAYQAGISVWETSRKQAVEQARKEVVEEIMDRIVNMFGRVCEKDRGDETVSEKLLVYDTIMDYLGSLHTNVLASSQTKDKE